MPHTFDFIVFSFPDHFFFYLQNYKGENSLNPYVMLFGIQQPEHKANKQLCKENDDTLAPRAIFTRSFHIPL